MCLTSDVGHCRHLDWVLVYHFTIWATHHKHTPPLQMGGRRISEAYARQAKPWKRTAADQTVIITLLQPERPISPTQQTWRHINEVPSLGFEYEATPSLLSAQHAPDTDHFTSHLFGYDAVPETHIAAQGSSLGDGGHVST